MRGSPDEADATGDDVCGAPGGTGFSRYGCEIEMRRNRDTNGEKRPASPVSAAVHAMRIATGEIKEDPEVLARKRARREFPTGEAR